MLKRCTSVLRNHLRPKQPTDRHGDENLFGWPTETRRDPADSPLNCRATTVHRLSDAIRSASALVQFGGLNQTFWQA